MSGSTNLRTNICFNRCTFRSKSEVEEALESRNIDIQDILWDIVRKNTDLTSIELRELTEDLEEAFVDKYKLQLLLDSWDKCHTEDDKPVRDGDSWNKKPEIWGDFLEEDSLKAELLGINN